MRSIQYERAEERTGGEPAGRKRGNKESSKVRMEGTTRGRRSEGRFCFFFSFAQKSLSEGVHGEGSGPLQGHTCAHACTRRRGDV